MTEVVAALLWESGHLAICQRPAGKARGLLWEFPGGKVEDGETGAQALIRECREELGVEILPAAPWRELTYPYPDLTVHLTFYPAVVTAGILQRREHVQIRWILPEEITQYDFCPADEPVVEEIARGGGREGDAYGAIYCTRRGDAQQRQ